MLRRSRRPALTEGDCACWAHDHPHPSGWPWHFPSRLRFLAVDSEGRRVSPRTEEERRDALLVAGCTTCSAVAGGKFRDYLTRTRRS